MGAIFLRYPNSLFHTRHSFDTNVAEVKDIKLGDGTRVTLGAASHIDVDFGKGQRRVVLTRGEAFFDVTRDASRPFLVTAGQTVVRVLGTQFDVHYGARAVRVAVLEGRVELLKANDSSSALDPNRTVGQILTPGHEAIAQRSGEITATDEVKKEDLGAWRDGRLVYVDARLRDVVGDINRYYRGNIDLADESTGNLQLTAAFRVDQIDRMLEVLQSAIPVEAIHAANGRIVLRERLLTR